MTSTKGSYYLGVDLGTTYAGAGILRQGRPEVVTLGARSAVVPSVLYFREDGEVLVGEPANRRGLTDPSRVVREFKRRVGDSTPMIVGTTPYSAEALLARLLRFVHDEVVKRQGSVPASVTVTHPANWGPYKIDVLQQAVRMAEIGEVGTLTEPVAAAVHFAATERLDPGQAVAVYDLGGGTFDAAVVRKTVSGGSGAGLGSGSGLDSGGPSVGFELLGDVEGIERLGGIDLDEAVFQHVVRWCESAFAELDPSDQSVLQAVARVRQECVAAKEALSADTDASIPVVLPNLQTEVRLTRAEFEAMIRPLLQQTVDALRRAVRSAEVEVGDLAAVLLVGGSSQIPLVVEMVSAELGRPIAVDQHPKHTVALGAAISGAQRSGSLPLEPAGSASASSGSASEPGSGSGSGSAEPSPSKPSVAAAGVAASGAPDSMSGVSGHAVGVPDPAIGVPDPAVGVPAADGTPLASVASPVDGGPLASLLDDGPPLVGDEPTVHWQPPPGRSPEGGDRDRRSDTRVMPAGGSPHRGGPVVSARPPATPPFGGDTFSGRAAPEPQRGRLVAVVAAVVALVAIGGAIWAVTQRGPAADPLDDNGDLLAGPEATSTTESSVGSTATTEPAAGETTSTSAASSSTASTASSTTTTSTTSTTAVAVFSATITDIVIADGRYAVSYSTNFSPLISSDPSSTHLHFFFDTVRVAEAGVPGGGPWILYDTPAPFTGYGPADRPSGATQMCVTAANHAHEVVDVSLFHCMDLPDA